MLKHQLAACHDREWGVPLHNDNKIFEFLILEEPLDSRFEINNSAEEKDS